MMQRGRRNRRSMGYILMMIMTICNTYAMLTMQLLVGNQLNIHPVRLPNWSYHHLCLHQMLKRMLGFLIRQHLNRVSFISCWRSLSSNVI